LKERMKDPNRLFKSRGKALFKEEQDRRKVNMIPRRKDELLVLAQHRGNLMVFDKPLSTLVEDYALECAKLFPPPAARASKNLTPSSNRDGKSFTTGSNKKASPRFTKRLGKYYTSPVGRSATRILRTPLSAQPASRMVGVSPLARSGNRMTRAKTPLSTCRVNTFSRRRQKLQVPDLVHPNDGSFNESSFSDNVPCNSTVLYNDTFSIDNMKTARDAAELQDRTRAQDIGQSATGRIITRVPAGSKIPRQATTAQPPVKRPRKMRRSKSCSEIALATRKLGGQRPRLGFKPAGQGNLPSVREESGAASRPAMFRSNSCLTAGGRGCCGKREAVQGKVQK